MDQNTLTVAAHRLGGISLFTLRQWCKAAGIDLEEQRSKADPRQKWITEEQLKQLAQAHGRVLDQPAQAPEPIPPNAYKLLIEQAAQAQQQAGQISADHTKLQAELTGLREQIGAASAALEQAKAEQATLRGNLEALRTQELEPLRQDIAAQLAAIQRDQAEQEQATMRRLDTLLETSKLTRTYFEAMQADQQEATARIDTLVTAIGRQQQELAALQAQQEQTRADLDTLTATQQELAAASDEQRQQLAGRVDELERQAEQAQKDMQAQLEQIKAAMQEQLQQAQKGLKAEFQAALHVLRQEMQEELERRVQGIEAEQTRDVADITRRQEQLQTQVENAAIRAEAATTTASGSQRRLFGVEQQLAALDKRMQQAEQEARERSAAGTISAAPQSGNQKQPRQRGRQPKMPPTQ